jgi:(E)-4-hydroxy-3-methylbut-2-enyl-diphosphate synthase
MTKTETANLGRDDGADPHRRRRRGRPRARRRCPREKDVEALKDDRRRVADPVIADIHFNHTLALKAIDAGRTASA